MLGWDEDPRGLRYPECNDDQLGSDMDVGSNSNTELGAVGLRSCWQEITTTVTVAQMKKTIYHSFTKNVYTYCNNEDATEPNTEYLAMKTNPKNRLLSYSLHSQDRSSTRPNTTITTYCLHIN